MRYVNRVRYVYGGVTHVVIKARNTEEALVEVTWGRTRPKNMCIEITAIIEAKERNKSTFFEIL
jgi:hypothetical protein